MNEALFSLATHLRLMNLAYHNAHNIVAGSSFFADHKAFEGWYKDLDDDYDAIVERSLGMGFDEVADLKMQMNVLDAHISVLPPMNFHIALTLEVHLNEIITHIDTAPGVTPGLRNLIGDIADRSEVRQYKIKQRIKGV